MPSETTTFFCSACSECIVRYHLGAFQQMRRNSDTECCLWFSGRWFNTYMLYMTRNQIMKFYFLDSVECYRMLECKRPIESHMYSIFVWNDAYAHRTNTGQYNVAMKSHLIWLPPRPLAQPSIHMSYNCWFAYVYPIYPSLSPISRMPKQCKYYLFRCEMVNSRNKVRHKRATLPQTPDIEQFKNFVLNKFQYEKINRNVWKWYKPFLNW